MVCTETDSVKTTSFFLICATLTQLRHLTMSSDNAYVESIAESIVREYLSRKVTTYVCSKTVAVQNTSLFTYFESRSRLLLHHCNAPRLGGHAV